MQIHTSICILYPRFLSFLLFLSLHTNPTPYLQRQLLCWWIMVNNLTSDRSTPCPVARHMHLRQALQSAESADAIAIDFFWNSAVKDDLSFSFFLRWHTFLWSPRHYDRSAQKSTTSTVIVCYYYRVSYCLQLHHRQFCPQFRQWIKYSARRGAFRKSRESEQYNNQKCKI